MKTNKFIKKAVNPCYYAIYYSNEKYKKLLAIQESPEIKYWFKDKEITNEQLFDILERAKF